MCRSCRNDMTKYLVACAAVAAAMGCGNKQQAAAPDHGVRLVYEIDPHASPFAPDSADRALEQGLEAVRQRLDELQLDQPSAFLRDGRIVVELAPVAEEQLASLRTLFARRDRLAFRIVATELTQTRAWARLADEAPAGAGVRSELDHWSHYESNTQYQDTFLAAADRKTLERFLTDVAVPAAPLPDGHRVVYERLEPRPDTSRAAEWRTYVIDERSGFVPVFARASVAFDPTTNLPLVEAELDRAGTRTFGELTRAHVGHKLAIVIGDTISAAPVIHSEIGGGRVWINMGGSDARVQQREAEELAATLRASDLAMPLVLARVEQF
jgi:preprotein translocase subunit SecD